jgi:hypothetical protein
MGIRSKKASGGSDGVAISPVLLAGVLALLWVVLSPGGGELGTPDWGMPIMVGTRFLVGFVAGWVVISLAQIALRMVWMGALQVYVWSRRH